MVGCNVTMSLGSMKEKWGLYDLCDLAVTCTYYVLPTQLGPSAIVSLSLCVLLLSACVFCMHSDFEYKHPCDLMKSSACLCSISTLLQVSKCQTLDFGLVKTVIENTSKKTETVTYYFDGCVAYLRAHGVEEREKKRTSRKRWFNLFISLGCIAYPRRLKSSRRKKKTRSPSTSFLPTLFHNTLYKMQFS